VQPGRLPPTYDDDILLVPHEIPKDGIEAVSGIWHEHDFLRPSTDEPGHAASGRIEVLRKMQFDKSVDIPLYGPESSFSGSRNGDWHGAIGA
jgi:hypothetical protein